MPLSPALRLILAVAACFAALAPAASAQTQYLYDARDQTPSDFGGTAQHGTWNGGSAYVSELSNPAFSFSGTNTITTPNVVGTPAQRDFTASFRLKKAVGAAGGYLAKRQACNGATGWWDMRFGADAVGIELGGSNGGYTAFAAPYPNDGAWHTVTFTRKGTEIVWSVDGVRGNTGSTGHVYTLDANWPMVIGTSPCAGPGGDGTPIVAKTMDDVRFVDGVAVPATPKPGSPTSITGTAKRGLTLTAVDGDFGGTSPTYTRQWHRCDSAGNNCNTPVGSGTTYTPGLDDVGNKLRLTVTAENAYGSATGSAFSATVAPAASSANVPTSDMRLWVKADAIAAANGSAVTSWEDASPFDNDLTKAGTGDATLVSNGLGGMPALQFARTARFNGAVAKTMSAGAKAYDMFVVASPSDQTGFGGPDGMGGYSMISWGQHGDANKKVTLRTLGGNRRELWTYWYNNDQGTRTLSTPFNGTTPFIAQSSFDGTVREMRENGKRISVAPGCAPTACLKNTTASPITIGAAQASGGEDFSGRISEVLVYDRALSCQERFEVTKYLGEKYGLSTPTTAFGCGGAVYWGNTQDGTIGKAGTDGTDVDQQWVSGKSSVVGLALTSSHLHYMRQAGNTIGRMDLGAAGDNASFITGASDPYQMVTDGRFLYWAGNDGANGVFRAPIGGGAPVKIVDQLNGDPVGVAIFGSWLYFSDAQFGTIGRAKLDGNGGVVAGTIERSWITGASRPNGIVATSTHVYWTNTNGNTIGRAPLDGSNPDHNFITGASKPFMVATDGTHLFWSNIDSDTIGRAKLDKSDLNQSFIMGAKDPHGLAVSATESDGDTVIDGADNCPAAANTNQADADGDGKGDACDVTVTQAAADQLSSPEGSPITVTGAFTTPGGGAPTISANNDQGTFTDNGNGTWKWTYTPADDQAAKTIKVTATDQTGESGTDEFTYSVANVAPTLSFADESREVNESTTDKRTFTYSVSDPGNDTYTVTASCGAHGVVSEETPGSFKCLFKDGPSASTVSATAKDSDNATGPADAVAVTIKNVAPSVTFTGGPTSVNEDVAEHAYSYSISDPGADTVNSVSTSCGIGGTKVGGSDANTNSGGSFRCQFLDGPATPTVTANATDSNNGAGANGTRGVTVHNVAPTLTSMTPPVADVMIGQSHTWSFTGTDPSPADEAALKFQVLWGDGTSSTSASPIAKTYLLPGDWTVTARALDKDGGLSAPDTRPEYSGGMAIAPSRSGVKRALMVGGTSGPDGFVIKRVGSSSISVQSGDEDPEVFALSASGEIVVSGSDGDDEITIDDRVVQKAIVFGGPGDDLIRTSHSEGVVSGGPGSDRLVGDNGREMLYGGSGKDMITGGKLDDLLVAGRVAWEMHTYADRLALTKVRNEWIRRNVAYGTRIARLRGVGASRGGNGKTFLQNGPAGRTVFDDLSLDTLVGDTGDDWFVANTDAGNPVDDVDALSGETVSDLDGS